MTYKELKASLTEDQKKILQFIWESKSLHNRNGPPIDVVHRKFKSKAIVVNAISSLPKDCVKESTGGIDSTYYLNLLGVFLAQDNNRLGTLVIRFLQFARDWFLTHERDQRITCQDIQEDLKLSDRDTSLLGKFLLRGYLPVTGGSSGATKNDKWNIELSQQASELFDVVDFSEYLENLVMSYYQDDENNATEASSIDSEKSSPEDIKLDITEKFGAEKYSDGVEVIHAEPQKETISTTVESDRATANDTLGFQPYVEALHIFLMNEKTTPPLIVTIEGEWGTGKSSFLLQLKSSIDSVRYIGKNEDVAERAFQENPKPVKRDYSKFLHPLRFLAEKWNIAKLNRKQRKKKNYTVLFDPWRYNEQKGIWAAFGLQLMKQLSKECKIIQRFKAWFALSCRRIRLSKLLVTILLPILITAILFLLFWFLIPGSRNLIVDLFGGSADSFNWQTVYYPSFITAALAVLIKIGKFFIVSYPIPQSNELNRYLKKPDYQRYSPIVDTYIEDFSHILKAYIGDNRVFVFIEDLDRCSPSSAINLMSTINLMLIDNPRMIVIIAMNTRLVAACFGFKNKETIQISSRHYRNSNEPKKSDDIILEEGFHFTEKFIQLPFQVPKPNEDAIKRFLSSLSSQNRENVHEIMLSDEKIEKTHNNLDNPTPIQQETGDSKGNKRYRQGRILVDPGIDSESIKAITVQIAHILDFNPRKIILFLNRFRLRVYIAEKLGLLDRTDRYSPEEEFTLEKLAKLVLLEMLVPSVCTEIFESKSGLSRYQEYFLTNNEALLSEMSTGVSISANKEMLRKILIFGCEDEEEKMLWDLQGLDISMLTHIRNVPDRGILRMKPQISALYTTYGLKNFQSSSQMDSDNISS